jgi:hypothetical protein
MISAMGLGLHEARGLHYGWHMGKRFLLMAGLPWMVLSCPAQSDFFNHEGGEGWTQLDFIGQSLGSSHAVFEVQAGQYRLSCGAPPEADVGVARVASYRMDQGYGSFLAVVDVVSWNQALDQSFGLLGRLQGNPQPGAMSGYSLTYGPYTRQLAISRLDAEVAVPLASFTVSLPPGDAYRLVFSGEGSALSGAVYNLSAPLQPMAVLSATDGRFWAGFCGLLGTARVPDGEVKVTFDSYEAGPASPPELGFSVEAGWFTVQWPRLTGAWHLETSPGLEGWRPVRDGGVLDGGSLTFSSHMAGRQFYRLAAGW